MADVVKVLEEKPEENEEMQTEMLPPELPKSSKTKGSERKQEEECKVSKQIGRSTVKMLPPSHGSGVKSERGPTESDEKDVVPKTKKEKFPEIPYKEPSWSGIADEPYNLELLKGGCIISTKYLTEKPYYLFGRLPNCDIVMEHPSISRYHAVIQYKSSQNANSDKGFYLYDLGSTHGTVVNKIQIEPKRYYRIRVGYVMKFGGSSRLYILQGPEDMEDDETLAQLQEESTKLSSEVGKVMSEDEYKEWIQQKERKPEEDEGISWGFGEDAVEDDVINPFASETLEEMESHVFKDPKKTLRGFFEREGLDLEYMVDETGPGHARVYCCRVKLPVETASGDPLYAEAAVTGKKREAVLACASEACRILDMNGLLRQSSHESKRQKIKNWEENDYYDSDEDTFLDRTGSIEKKRITRMKQVKKDKQQAETFDSLSSKLRSVEEEIASLEAKLKEAMQASKTAQESEDSLESYMKNIDKCMDKASRMQMRRKIFDLKKEKQQLSKLVKIARPASLPDLINQKMPLEGVKESDLKTEDKIVKTPSASTCSPDQSELTTEAKDYNIRQNPTVTDGLGSTASHNHSKDSSVLYHLGSSTKEVEKKTNQFTLPALPSSKKLKTKQHSTAHPPDSSLSKMLEELKNSDSCEKETVREHALEKHQHTKDQTKSFEEPAKEKKRKLMPQYLQSSPPNSPPRLTQASSHFDEDYSDWTPPTDQSGDVQQYINKIEG